MAAKRTIPAFKKAAPKVDDRAAALKEAAAKAPADDAPAYTHQGPGTGKAGAVDPAASAAILNAGKAAASVETKSAALEAAASCRNLRVLGLMGMAPFTPDKERRRATFRELYCHYLTLEPSQRHILSMGMTDDFEIAIEEGSTMVRIGTALFGPRT